MIIFRNNIYFKDSPVDSCIIIHVFYLKGLSTRYGEKINLKDNTETKRLKGINKLNKALETKVVYTNWFN